MKYLLFVLLIATPAFAQTYLESALTFVPDDFIRANFSNWELIRADLGVTRADLDAEDAYAEFARIVLEERIDLNRYGRWRDRRADHDWGWDHRDLEWQVTAQGSQNETLFIMKFYEGFSFVDLTTLLTEQGYELSNYKDTAIYTHNLVEPVRFMDPAFHSAILEEQQLILASDALEPLQLAIDTALGYEASFKDDAAMQALAKSWDNADIAALAKGARICPSSRFPDEEFKMLNETYDLTAFDAFGLGFVSEPIDYFLFSFAFNSPELAQANLEPRQELAELDEKGSEGVFRLEDAEQRDKTLTFSLEPLGGLNEFLGLIDRLYFTVCP